MHDCANTGWPRWVRWPRSLGGGGVAAWVVALWLLGCGLAAAATPYDFAVTAIPGLEMRDGAPYPLRVSLTVPSGGLGGFLEVSDGPKSYSDAVLVRDLELGQGQFVIWLYPRLLYGPGSSVTVSLFEGDRDGSKRQVASHTLTIPPPRPSLTPLTVYWLSARDRRGAPRLFDGVEPQRALRRYVATLSINLAVLLKEEANKIRDELLATRSNGMTVEQEDHLAEMLQAVTEVEESGAQLIDRTTSGAVVDLFARYDRFPRERELRQLADLALASQVDAAARTDAGLEGLFSPYESGLAPVLPDPASFGPTMQLSRFDTATKLPDSWQGYVPADLVVWDAGAPLDELSVEQQAALQAWVEGGGRLLMVGLAMEEWRSPCRALLPDPGTRWMKTLGPSTEPEATAVEDEAIGLTGWPSGPVMMLLDRDGAMLKTDKDGNLIKGAEAVEVYLPAFTTPRRLLYRRSVGFGVVDLLRVSYPELSNYPAEEVAELLVGRSKLGPPHSIELEQLRSQLMGNGGRDASTGLLTPEQVTHGWWYHALARRRDWLDMRLRESDASALTQPIAGRSTMLLLIGVFLVVIGVVDRLILRKLRREPLTWVTAPLWIALFSALAWSLYGGISLQKDPQQRLVFVDQNPSGTESRVEEWITFKHSGPSDRVSVPSRALVDVRRTFGREYSYGYRRFLRNESMTLQRRTGLADESVDSPGERGSFGFLQVVHRTDYAPCPYQVRVDPPGAQGMGYRWTVAAADGAKPIYGLVLAGERLWTLRDEADDGQLRSQLSMSLNDVLTGSVGSEAPPTFVAHLRLFDVLLAAERPRTQTNSRWYDQMNMGYRKEFPTWGRPPDLARTVRDGRSALALVVDRDPQGNLRVWTQLLPLPSPATDADTPAHDPPQVND